MNYNDREAALRLDTALVNLTEASTELDDLEAAYKQAADDFLTALRAWALPTVTGTIPPDAWLDIVARFTATVVGMEEFDTEQLSALGRLRNDVEASAAGS